MIRFLFGLVTVSSMLALAPASAATFGSNLIVNGDAEIGTPDASGGIVAVPGWSGTATIAAYGTPGGFPGGSDPGVSAGANNFFAGGPDFAFSTLFQAIDLSSGGGLIDGGTVVFSLSAFLGGFSSQRDYARVNVTFYDASNTIIATANPFNIFAITDPVTDVDRANATGLLLRSTGGFVPTGARSAGIGLDFTRVDGSYNDGYADNISFVLTRGGITPVPEPSTWTMMLAGFGGLGWTLRKRNRAPISFA